MIDQPKTMVATKTKSEVAMKTLLAVTVVTASLAAMSAFGLVAVKNVKALLPPLLTVNVSNDTPRAAQIVVPMSQVDLLHVDMKLRSNQPVTVGTIVFNLPNNIGDSNVGGSWLYTASGQLLAGPVAYDRYHQTVTFTGRLTVPASAAFRLVLKTDIGAAPAGKKIRALINPARNIIAIRPPVGFRVMPNRNLLGYVMTIKARPQVGTLTVALDPGSPRGNYVGVPNGEVLRLKLTASSEFDITVDNIEVLMAGTANITGASKAKWVSEDGQTDYAVFPSGANNIWMKPGIDFDVKHDATGANWTNPLIIPAGGSKIIKLFGDTTGSGYNQVLQAKIIGSTNTVSGIIYVDGAGNKIDSLTTRNLPIVGNALLF